MKHRIFVSIGLALLVLLGLGGGAHAADKVKAVASFSILGDMVKQVGGDRVEVITLVGPNGDAHVYEPTPTDGKNLAIAQIRFTNGLGFEGWMDRLEKSSGFKGKVVVASTGVKPRTMVEDEKTITDPHAWQSLANGRLYVANIRDGLIAVDPEGKSVYEANAAKYLDEIAKEESDVKAALATLPQDRRKIITSHDAFGYFGAAYGLEIIAPEGVSTESEASAKDVAKIIRQIKAKHIRVFMENITDHRLLDQIASEAGAKIGGELYTDALSPADGPASTYLDMFRHNVGALSAALRLNRRSRARGEARWPFADQGVIRDSRHIELFLIGARMAPGGGKESIVLAGEPPHLGVAHPHLTANAGFVLQAGARADQSLQRGEVQARALPIGGRFQHGVQSRGSHGRRRRRSILADGANARGSPR
jgi:zinc/manganese transport system substrate-binding protein